MPKNVLFTDELMPLLPNDTERSYVEKIGENTYLGIDILKKREQGSWFVIFKTERGTRTSRKIGEHFFNDVEAIGHMTLAQARAEVPKFLATKPTTKPRAKPTKALVAKLNAEERKSTPAFGVKKSDLFRLSCFVSVGALHEVMLALDGRVYELEVKAVQIEARP